MVSNPLTLTPCPWLAGSAPQQLRTAGWPVAAAIMVLSAFWPGGMVSAMIKRADWSVGLPYYMFMGLRVILCTHKFLCSYHALMLCFVGIPAGMPPPMMFPANCWFIHPRLAVPIEAPSAFRSRASGPYSEAVAVPCLAAPLFCWHHGSALATSRVSCAAAS